ncbi:MAG: hypothetical protein JKY56_02945 [Kofleriaceae bacterium]|nr:hypothetical protein [Kofleriaceae bacterium]
MHKLACLAILILACGDSRVDESKERITQAAYERACQEADDFLTARYSGDYFVQALCLAEAVETTGDATSCGAQLDSCINNPPPEIQAGIDGILSQAGCNLLNVDTSVCSSTLGDIRACLEAIDEEVMSLRYTLSCAAAGQSLEDWDVLSLPESCRFESDC